MSNETDLDWLVRVTGGIIEPWCEFIARSGLDSWACARVFDLERHWFTREQYLARRAELQSKPSWGAVPSHANWLAQDAAGSWIWHWNKPEHRNGMWINGDTRGYAAKGAVLGDWRDTLEKRPKQFNPSIEEANRLAKELKPFTSIEDNQDREGVNQKLNELEMLGKVSHLISDKRHRITTSKYTKTIHGVPVDVYDVLMAWGVTNPALQHLIKKALQCGQRGHKDDVQDLQDIIDSAIRAKELG